MSAVQRIGAPLVYRAIEEPWHRGRSLEIPNRFVKYGSVAEPRLDFYFLPFFLFSGLYLSFQILHDTVSMGPLSQISSEFPRPMQ